MDPMPDFADDPSPSELNTLVYKMLAPLNRGLLRHVQPALSQEAEG